MSKENSSLALLRHEIEQLNSADRFETLLRSRFYGEKIGPKVRQNLDEVKNELLTCEANQSKLKFGAYRRANLELGIILVELMKGN